MFYQEPRDLRILHTIGKLIWRIALVEVAIIIFLIAYLAMR